MIKRIQSEVIMKRIRIHEYFIDFDKLRKGFVSSAKYRTVMGLLNFNFTNEEYESIYNRYVDDGNFRYPKFCELINSNFTNYNLQNEPLADVKQLTNCDTIECRRTVNTLNESEQNNLEIVLNKFRKLIKTKRVLLKPQFQDFDIPKAGVVSRHQFVRVLNNANLQPTSCEENILVKR